MPSYCRAAVMLGANLSKDCLVQACMRMRKLGKGQSVTFCATDEIRTKIQDCTLEDRDAGLTVADVLRWSMFESPAETRRRLPLWRMHGQRFLHQDGLWRAATYNGRTCLTEERATEFLEDEARSLNRRYRPRLEKDGEGESWPNGSDDVRSVRIRERCRYLGGYAARRTGARVFPRNRAKAANGKNTVSVHPDLTSFVFTRMLVPESPSYSAAFESLSNLNAAEGFEVAQLNDNGSLLVTTDFARTVVHSCKAGTRDDFQRPTQWALTTTPGEDKWVKQVMILSPHEAQELYPLINEAKRVALHRYGPRWNRAYRALDRLDFFTMPAISEPRALLSSLATQLNLFAGQLYFSNAQEYIELCIFLGMAAENTRPGWIVHLDGFVMADDKGRVGAGSGLQTSPVNILKALMQIRGDGECIAKTHVGRMLHGILLDRSDVEGDV
ncbi:hypothetical protein LTR17_014475 [Elasticomyces elasticus]|nr:hypothetical protein LTR17_014475 [Elasticomyces elasticus]